MGFRSSRRQFSTSWSVRISSGVWSPRASTQGEGFETRQDGCPVASLASDDHPLLKGLVIPNSGWLKLAPVFEARCELVRVLPRQTPFEAAMGREDAVKLNGSASLIRVQPA